MPLKWPWVGAEGTRGAGGFATLLGAVGVGVRLVQLLKAEDGAEKCLNLLKKLNLCSGKESEKATACSALLVLVT